jgi:hypothetical protein
MAATARPLQIWVGGGFLMVTRFGFALALVVTACNAMSDTIATGDPVGDTEDEGQVRGEQLAAQISAEFAIDDQPTVIAQTGSMLRAINDGEINQSAFAVQVVQDDDTFRFANDLIAMHEDANAQLDDVMRIYGLAFVPTQAEANLVAVADEGLAVLRTAPQEQVDFDFAELQVRMHATARVVVDELDTMVESGPMVDYIANTRRMIDQHLARAEALLNSFY